MDIDIARVIGRTGRESCGGGAGFAFRFSVRTGVAVAGVVPIAAARARGRFVNDTTTDNADKRGVTVPGLYRTPRLSLISIGTIQEGSELSCGSYCIARRPPWATKLQRRVRAAPIAAARERLP